MLPFASGSFYYSSSSPPFARLSLMTCSIIDSVRPIIDSLSKAKQRNQVDKESPFLSSCSTGQKETTCLKKVYFVEYNFMLLQCYHDDKLYKPFLPW